MQEKEKLLRSLDLLTTDDKIPHHYVKFIRDGIYEFRSNYGNTEFRVFFINDGNTIPGVELCACRSLFAQNLSRFEYFVNKKNNSTFVLHDRNQTSYTIWSLKYLN